MEITSGEKIVLQEALESWMECNPSDKETEENKWLYDAWKSLIAKLEGEAK